MTTGSTGNRSLVLLFGPGCLPLSETAAFYAGLLGVPSPEAIPYTLRLGLAHNQTLSAPSLIVSRGNIKQQTQKMSGKQTIARLLWALSHPTSKEASLKTASDTDDWLSLARQGTLSPMILKKLSES